MKSKKHSFDYIYKMSEKEINDKFTLLGEGHARRVFGIDDRYVIKVAKGKNGIFQNQFESYVYSNAEKSLLKYLCPVVAFKNDILIMERAETLSNSQKNIDLQSIRTEKGAYHDLTKLSEKFHLYHKDLIASSSWGTLHGKNVLIDYGYCGKKVKREYQQLFHKSQV